MVIFFSLSLFSCDSCEEDNKIQPLPEIKDNQLGYSYPDNAAYAVPTDNAIDITFTFNEGMDSATINGTTFTVKDQDNNFLDGTVFYNTETKTATFRTDFALSSVNYTAALSTEVKYRNGSNLENIYRWTFTTAPRYWTIMVYLDADNDLENLAMEDVDEMLEGYNDLQGLDLIVLIDRIDDYSDNENTLGQDFSDTRLYRITKDLFTRLDGGTKFPEITKSSNHEANMGDAGTLKKFIDYCKSYYPADNYGLILWNHGDGVLGRYPNKKSTINNLPRAICVDNSNGDDVLFMGEITDEFTSTEHIDLLGFDACFMGSVEVAYQFRPGNGSLEADIMVASSPEEWGYGWKYNSILERIKAGNGNNGEQVEIAGSGTELYYDPDPNASQSLTALTLGEIIVEEQYDSIERLNIEDQSLSCYDLSYIEDVKNAIDALAVSLSANDEKDDLETVRGYLGSANLATYYFRTNREIDWLNFPFFDLYNLCKRIKNEESGTSFHSDITENNGLAENAMTAVDDLVVYSFAGSDFPNIENGKTGIHIVFPDGDRQYNGSNHWEYQWWYNAIDTNLEYETGHLYGKLSWCIENATQGNGVVENWFELLDSWFDENNDSDGGLNAYQY